MKPNPQCRTCGRRLSSVCRRCFACSSCGCTCTPCATCGTMTPQFPASLCNRCHRCKPRGCCTCRNIPHYSYEIVPRWTPSRLNPNRPALALNPLARGIGVEQELSHWGTIEQFRFRTLQYTKEWDRSVEPSHHEMSIGPMLGDLFLTAITELGYAMAQHGANVNNTCGYHVHVAGADLSHWEIRRLLIVWNNIEREVYRYLIAPHRRNVPTVTHFCQMLTSRHEQCDKCLYYIQQHGRAHYHTPSLLPTILARMEHARSTGDIKTILFRELYGIQNSTNEFRDLMTRKGGKYEWCRYFGLNLHSWMYRGTVEFRMKEATTDLAPLALWPLWCGWLVHTMTRISDAQASAVRSIRDLSPHMPRYVAAWAEGQLS